MGCLYCGKDIGPFRLFRDDEFCSSAHRKRYGERLGKVLDRIGAPELVPSAMPGVCGLWPVQEGHRKQTEGVWDFGHPDHPVQIGELWPLTITPTLGAGSKPLRSREPVARAQPAAWSNRPPEPFSLPVSLPVFQQSLQSGRPVLVRAAAGRPQAGLPPRVNQAKARVLFLPVPGSTLAKGKPAAPICLPAFENTLRSGLPVLNAAVTGSLQEGIAPRQSQLKARVFPLPVGPATTTKPKTVERSCHPVLRRVETRMPSLAAEAVARHVWPSAAIALHGGMTAVLPSLKGLVRKPQVAPRSQWELSPPAEPVTVLVLPRMCLSPADVPFAESTAVVLPSLEHFHPIHDVPLDLADVPGLPEIVGTPDAKRDRALPRSGCPALGGPAPAPVESLFSFVFVPSPMAAADTHGLRLPRVDPVFDLPLAMGRSTNPAAGRDRALPRSGFPSWPSPVPSLIPTRVAQSPATVEANAPALRLPSVDLAAELPSLARSETRAEWPSPDEAFIPPASGPTPIAAATDGLRLPGVDLIAELHSSLGTPETQAAGCFNCPTWPKPVESPVPAASVPRPIALATGALRLPGVELAAGLHSSLDTSGTLPRWLSPVESPIPAASNTSPIAVMPDVPGLRLPSLELAAGIPPSLSESGTYPYWPRPTQSLTASATAPGPTATAANVFPPRLPSVGRAFELPSLLGRSRTAGRGSALSSPGGPTLSVVAQPVQAVSVFAPAPVPIEPPAIVLSLPRPGKPVTGSAATQVGPTAGPAPSPVESLPAIAAFAPFRIGRSPELQFPQVPVRKSAGLAAAGSGPSYPPVAAPEPRELNPHAAVIKPISFLRLNRLAVPGYRPTPAIPQPGFIPIEFYCQRGLVAPCQRLTWKTPLVDPLFPRFAMRIVADRTDDLAPWKPAPKPAAHQEIPAISQEAKRRARERAIGRFLKIAACLVMGVSLWFGARELRTGGSPAIAIRGSGAPADAPTAAGAPPAGRAPAVNESKGVMAGVRHAIANRAATSVTDTLQSGMESWGSPAKSWAPGWSRNPDGYVHPGELALFHPSLGYKDYRLEFFGQIESKSMGWAVRAHDKQNYYAMKFTVIEAGLRPVIAMAHYPVVDGKKGHTVETPLSVMVHHNTPIHVAVDVQGNRVTASVEGQQVDSWTDDLLPAGGVGFFSEAGERARLYWMKVSKNQDWLGVICSYLSADSRETAEVWGPGIPANIPAPAEPAQPQDVSLAEAETSANDFSSPQRARIWIQRRIRPWST